MMSILSVNEQSISPTSGNLDEAADQIMEIVRTSLSSTKFTKLQDCVKELFKKICHISDKPGPLTSREFTIGFIGGKYQGGEIEFKKIEPDEAKWESINAQITELLCK